MSRPAGRFRSLMGRRRHSALRHAPEMLTPIVYAYSDRLKQCGLDPRGVFWRTEEGQKLRFEILLGIIDPRFDVAGGVSINDLGCGYGALFDLLQDRPCMENGRYYGYDICNDMVEAARNRIDDPRASFEESMVAKKRADYSLVSGTFNMKMNSDPDRWLDYTKESLVELWNMSRRGLAFNMLSSHDRSKQSGLYYADPSLFLDFCMKNLSQNVSLMHDYPLLEWTIYVNR